MRTLSLLIALATVLGWQCAHARPLDNLGHCPLNAQVVPAAGSYQGTAPTALTVSAFARAHAAHTQDQMPWLAKLTGGSGRNRVYVQGKKKVLLVTVCDPANCERVRAYVAFEPSTNTWGARLYLDDQVQELGVPIMAGAETQILPQEVAQAVICAQNLDWGGRR